MRRWFILLVAMTILGCGTPQQGTVRASLALAGPRPALAGIQSPENAQGPALRITYPAPVRKAITVIAKTQRKVKRSITTAFRKTRTTGDPFCLFPLLLLCFIYGLVHAAGPGHGKAVLASYLLSRSTSVPRALLLGNIIAILHGLSALALAIPVLFAGRHMGAASLADFRSLRVVSSAAILGLGTIMFARNFRRASTVHEQLPAKGKGGKTFLPLALAVGLIPCQGAVILLLFAISARAAVLGIPMVVAMTAGMAVTLSALALLISLGRDRLTSPSLSGGERLPRVLELTGSLLLMLVGALLLMSNFH